MRLGNFIALILVVGLIVMACIDEIESRNSINQDYEEISTTAVVCDLVYTPPRTVMIWTGKAAIPMQISDRYNIYLLCEDNVYCIDNEDAFNQLKKGDSTKVIMHEKRDSKGEVLDRYLTFAEAPQIS